MKHASIHSAEHRILVDLLRELRVVRKLSQLDLAARMDRPQSYISAVERGGRGLDLLQVLEFTKAMGVTFTEFATELEKRFKDAGI